MPSSATFHSARLLRTVASQTRPLVSSIKMAAAAHTWAFTKENIAEATEKAIARHKAVLDEVSAIPADQCEFSNVAEPLLHGQANLTQATSPLAFLQHVSPDAAVREASYQSEVKLNDYTVEAGMRTDVYAALVAADKASHGSIQGEDKRAIQHYLRDLKRSGLGLSEEKRKQLIEVDQELSQACTQFGRNASEASGSLFFSKEELDGLPNDILENYPQETVDGVTKYKMTFKTPDYVPVMEHVKNPDVRKQAWIGYEHRMPKNKGLMEKIVSLRQKKVALLGYADWPAYQLETRMGKNSKTVNDFLNDLVEKLKPLGQRESKNLLELRAELRKEAGLPEDPQDILLTWDVAFLLKQYAKKHLDLDHNLVKQYLPVSHVVPAVLDIYQELLGVRFVKEQGAETWHSDVEKYKCEDVASGALLGYIYLDLFPRDNKYGHAAVFPLLPGGQNDDGTDRVPVCAMVANLAKPPKGLLTHDDAVTFFHELGHGLHYLCSKTKYSCFFGFDVELDFVEAPSQMLENWCYEPQILKRLSKHPETGEEIPDELIAKIVADRDLNSALSSLRQLSFGLFDMRIHTLDHEPKVGELNEISQEIGPEISLRSSQNEKLALAETFNHLASSYSAGYYGYMWSLVYATDMYTLFKPNPMSQEIGQKYRTRILLPGGTKDGNDLLVDFLGRQPSNKAFMERLLSGHKDD